VRDRLVLTDGRVLAYRTHGDGRPLLLFHGAPGSAGFVPGLVDGVRLITFDRPGYGESTPFDDRTVLDTAPDVVALLDALGIDRVPIVAWSGGCPFAVATAYALGPARISSLVLVSGPGPLDEVPGAWEALDDRRRPTAEMARVDPHRSIRAIDRHMQPFVERPEAFIGSGRGADADVLRDATSRAMLETQMRESVRQGARGLAADLVAMWLPWGFPLRDVAVPAQVFHAARDPHNDADTATYAKRIPGARRTVWPEAGHLGIVPCWREVVDAALGRPTLGSRQRGDR
jgi:pimeloyl-ACP methyl ester carboxylesterase